MYKQKDAFYGGHRKASTCYIAMGLSVDILLSQFSPSPANWLLMECSISAASKVNNDDKDGNNIPDISTK